MRRVFKHITTTFALLLTAIPMMADDSPTINPTATFVLVDGSSEEDATSFSGSAPVIGQFKANAENVGTWNATYEWRFYMEGNADNPYLIRYEEDTEYTFTSAGAHCVVLHATFTQPNNIGGTDTLKCESEVLSVIISESKLEMPNAFSPNGDGINDIYKAKDGYQSIIEFHAYIFNRWGQKLYEWSDPAGGWDGTYKGKDVKQGVYFVLVKAKGADGRTFTIKRDVNLLRGYTEASGTVTP